MTNETPSNYLTSKEICEYLNLTTSYGLPDLINYIWKQGYEWGYKRGYEDGKEQL